MLACFLPCARLLNGSFVFVFRCVPQAQADARREKAKTKRTRKAKEEMVADVSVPAAEAQA